jgi:hypothetical protein
VSKAVGRATMRYHKFYPILLSQFTGVELLAFEIVLLSPKAVASLLSAVSTNSNAVLAESADIAFRASLNIHRKIVFNKTNHD